MGGAVRFEAFAEHLHRLGAQAQSHRDAGRALLEAARVAMNEGRAAEARRLHGEAEVKLKDFELLHGEVLRQIKLVGEVFEPSPEYGSMEAYNEVFRRSLWELADGGDSGMRASLEALAAGDAWWARPS
jgi:hypothetical protein